MSSTILKAVIANQNKYEVILLLRLNSLFKIKLRKTNIYYEVGVDGDDFSWMSPTPV